MPHVLYERAVKGGGECLRDGWYVKIEHNKLLLYYLETPYTPTRWVTGHDHGPSLCINVIVRAIRLMSESDVVWR